MLPEFDSDFFIVNILLTRKRKALNHSLRASSAGGGGGSGNVSNTDFKKNVLARAKE